MRSIIRWAGSKRKLLPKLTRFWEVAPGRYLEPFAGSAALFFHISPHSGLLNDANEELIEALHVLSHHPNEIYEELAAIPINSETYYRVRSVEPISLSRIKRAARFYFLNRHCFNGIYRVNQAGRFNVPFASSRAGAIPRREEWIAASECLKGAVLSKDDFEAFCRREVKQGDFVYLDPPYAVSNRRIFRQYATNSFGIDDMVRLSRLLTEIDDRGARFVVSYALSPEGRELGKGWITQRVNTLRNVAGFQEHRRQAVEMFISNFSA